MYKIYDDSLKRYEVLDELLREAGISNVEVIISLEDYIKIRDLDNRI